MQSPTNKCRVFQFFFHFGLPHDEMCAVTEGGANKTPGRKSVVTSPARGITTLDDITRAGPLLKGLPLSCLDRESVSQSSRRLSAVNNSGVVLRAAGGRRAAATGAAVNTLLSHRPSSRSDWEGRQETKKQHNSSRCAIQTCVCVCVRAASLPTSAVSLGKCSGGG